MKKILFALLLGLSLLAGPTWADSIRGLLAVKSYHHSRNPMLNELPWGPAIQYDFERFENVVPHATLGAFKNSFNGWTGYAELGVGYQFNLSENWQVEPQYNLMYHYGYESTEHGRKTKGRNWDRTLFPSIVARYKDYGFRVVYLGDNLAAFQLEYKF